MAVYSQKKDYVDLAQYDFSFSLRNKLGRLLWNICYWFFYRPFNLDIFKGWRNFILRLFGARIGEKTSICASVKIWAPWNLEVGSFSSIGPQVICYNQGGITVGSNTVISQKTYLCASTHDHTIANFPLVLHPIYIGDQVWIAADAFIGPGVMLGEGSVVGARAAVFKEVEPWTIVGGNPAKFIKKRSISS
ncbi:putative colanic acid biosynthesis acetyltransferase [Salinimicrobium sp. TH3]|uniref:putative colanic acid biosynthesis acetyltransferase n=1 Tax=Salinimicrobium sp. TH3 TaxID=2997342 RepID=UPI002275FB17|nr:putative colanic acid biosynthesis acetyltransferase [Salinimicrobium sp. TH3]MCY2687942.1 putative colanic acid biosynthesis acetyltransferase [Salinimicrobium sp. TH3]